MNPRIRNSIIAGIMMCNALALSIFFVLNTPGTGWAELILICVMISGIIGYFGGVLFFRDRDRLGYGRSAMAAIVIVTAALYLSIYLWMVQQYVQMVNLQGIDYIEGGQIMDPLKAIRGAGIFTGIALLYFGWILYPLAVIEALFAARIMNRISGA